MTRVVTMLLSLRIANNDLMLHPCVLHTLGQLSALHNTTEMVKDYIYIRTGIEPATFRLLVGCSIHLSYLIAFPLVLSGVRVGLEPTRLSPLYFHKAPIPIWQSNSLE